jgi:hypothetical protein
MERNVDVDTESQECQTVVKVEQQPSRRSHVMRFLPYLFIAIVGLSLQITLAASTDIAESLLAKYGKDTLVPVIIKRCNGNITIGEAGAFKQVYGRPNKTLLSAATIAEDMERCNISPTDFAVAIRKEERTAPGQDVIRATGWTNRLLTKWQRRGLSAREVTLRTNKATEKVIFLNLLLSARTSTEFEEAELYVFEAAAIAVNFELCELVEDLLKSRELAKLGCDNDEFWVLSEAYIDANRGQIGQIKSVAAELLAIRQCDLPTTPRKRIGCLEDLRRTVDTANVKDKVREMYGSNMGGNGDLQREIIKSLAAWLATTISSAGDN